eukprot:2578571-Prymnesium_polylepis.2
MRGEIVVLTASARAEGASRLRTAAAAACSAVIPEEHAVSTVTQGLWKPSTNDRRPAAMETVSPVAAYTLPPPSPSVAKSVFMMPRKMPASLSRSEVRRCPDPRSGEHCHMPQTQQPNQQKTANTGEWQIRGRTQSVCVPHLRHGTSHTHTRAASAAAGPSRAPLRATRQSARRRTIRPSR